MYKLKLAEAIAIVVVNVMWRDKKTRANTVSCYSSNYESLFGQREKKPKEYVTVTKVKI